jgi:hypothetical protein
VPAFNARTAGPELAAVVVARLGRGEGAAAGQSGPAGTSPVGTGSRA